MAHLAQDPGLLDAFRNDRDVHKATASEVFGVELSMLRRHDVGSVKAINFGLIYGMSAHGLAKQIGCDRGQAQMYMDRYFARYPGVLDYMERTRKQASEQGYVETLFGRRLYLPDINAKNAAIRKGAERTAINAPMQGSAADIIKRAMITVDSWLAESDLDARVILQVHDENWCLKSAKIKWMRYMCRLITIDECWCRFRMCHYWLKPVSAIIGIRHIKIF